MVIVDEQIRDGCMYFMQKLHLTTAKLLQRSDGKSSRMREITIENLRGTTMKIALWGSAANQLFNIFPPFFTCCILNKISNSKESNSGRITLSSKNATKVYADADIPEVVEMRERCPYARPPRHITLLTAKWDPTCQTANVLICSATANHVLIENG
ncbi:hypothetical protein MKW92_021414 [Papaver armeniacum]|nr:hypothetical protein MKW92_021414 [Papaver armeniacum]